MNGSLATLLKAAEYIERRDRGLEHGYASTLPMPDDLRNPMKRPKTKKSQGSSFCSRTSHNELEKNRRKHLRTCLDKLKDIVPLGPEASRHTTLGLLTKARRFIKSLEDRDKRKAQMKENLSREQRYLRRKLDALAKSHGVIVGSATGTPMTASAAAAALAASKRRSVSECSSSTISSSHSSSSASSATASSHSSAPSPISETGESGYSSSPLPSPTLLVAPAAARPPLLPPLPVGDDHAYHRHTADVFDYDDAPDEVDVIGYTSTQSDTDDHSSVQSASSDSGVTMSTSRLTLSEIRDVYM